MKIKLILVLLILSGCAPRYKIAIQDKEEGPLNENYKVLVLNNDFGINLDGASLIAEIKGPFEKIYAPAKSITKGCGYTEIINDFKEKSKELGANIIHVYDLKKPTSFDNCYKLKAKLYKSFDSNLITNINQYNNSRRISKLDANSDYAMLYLYRPKAIGGMVVKFDIYIDANNFITNLKNGKKTAYKITAFGLHKLTAINQKGQKKEFSINVEKGQEYYVRCGIDVAKPYGVAQFSLLDNIMGYSEYNKMK